MNVTRVLTLMLAVCAGCGRHDSNTVKGPSDALPSVELALNWYAEAEHGGYVQAAEQGGFRRHGLDVKIRQGGPGAASLVIQELAAERIQFAVSSADLVILARAQKVPLVAVAAPLQQSPRCILVHQSSGIQSLEQLQNVTLAISDSRPFALWMKHKLPLTGVTMVPYSGDIGEFVRQPGFAQQGFVFSEPFVAREAGADPKVLMLSDIGFNPYNSLLVTTEKMIRQQPDIVRGMVEASIEGWAGYLQDPAATNAAIHRDNSEMSPAALQYGAKSMRPLCQPEDGVPLCGMTPERWQTLIDQIVEIGEIAEGSVQARECFDLSFLPHRSEATQSDRETDSSEVDREPTP
ncbi:MAG: ABC transporter substrate-binding protein [Planctomycetaceae bacterium]